MPAAGAAGLRESETATEGRAGATPQAWDWEDHEAKLAELRKAVVDDLAHTMRPPPTSSEPAAHRPAP